MKATGPSTIGFTMNVVCFINYLGFIAAISGFGSSLTKEAEKTVEVFGRMMNSSVGFGASRKVEMIYSMGQLLSRELKIQNDMFVIDWRAFVSVGSTTKLSNTFNNSNSQQIISTIFTYLVIILQFEVST